MCILTNRHLIVGRYHVEICQSGTTCAGHIYSRISNPDSGNLEDRLPSGNNKKLCAVFENEMEAIITKISCFQGKE